MGKRFYCKLCKERICDTYYDTAPENGLCYKCNEHEAKKMDKKKYCELCFDKRKYVELEENYAQYKYKYYNTYTKCVMCMIEEDKCITCHNKRHNKGGRWRCEECLHKVKTYNHKPKQTQIINSNCEFLD